MGAGGVDVKLSEKAAKEFPFSVECKNVERLQIWNALEQAEANKEDLDAMVVFKRNRSKVYCVIEFDKLLELLKDSRSK